MVQVLPARITAVVAGDAGTANAAGRPRGRPERRIGLRFVGRSLMLIGREIGLWHGEDPYLAVEVVDRASDTSRHDPRPTVDAYVYSVHTTRDR